MIENDEYISLMYNYHEHPANLWITRGGEHTKYFFCYVTVILHKGSYRYTTSVISLREATKKFFFLVARPQRVGRGEGVRSLPLRNKNFL